MSDEKKDDWDGSHPPPVDAMDADLAHALLLGRLLAAWRLVPEMRLGQLLSNAGGMLTTPPTSPDLFHQPDEVLLMKVEAFVKTKGFTVKG